MTGILTTIDLFLKGISWKVWAGLATLVLLASTVWYCQGQVNERIEQAEEIGTIEEQNRQLEQTITNVKIAEEAREEIKEPSPAGNNVRYNQCLRSARTPANCERFLSDVQ